MSVLGRRRHLAQDGQLETAEPNHSSPTTFSRLAELALESAGERRRRFETRAFGDEFDRSVAVRKGIGCDGANATA